MYWSDWWVAILAVISLMWFMYMLHKDLSDQEVMKHIRAGEKNYYEVFVRKYSPHMYRYLYHRFGFEKTVAEDYVQEILVHARTKIWSYDETKPFLQWLYTLAHNKTIDEIRKHKNTPLTIDDLQRELMGDDTAHAHIDQSSKQQLTDYVLAQLDQTYRDVVILYYFEQQSYQEIAEIMQRPVNSIGTLLSRAKQQIKQCVTNDPHLAQAVQYDLA